MRKAAPALRHCTATRPSATNGTLRHHTLAPGTMRHHTLAHAHQLPALFLSLRGCAWQGFADQRDAHKTAPSSAASAMMSSHVHGTLDKVANVRCQPDLHCQPLAPSAYPILSIALSIAPPAVSSSPTFACMSYSPHSHAHAHMARSCRHGISLQAEMAIEKQPTERDCGLDIKVWLAKGSSRYGAS